MSFILPELVIESVIRDGLAGLVNNPERIDDIFSSLTANYNSKKYGQKELARIKSLILKKQIKVVHNLSDVGASVPAYSLQLGSDVERVGETVLEDFSGETLEEKTDPAELAALVKAAEVIPLSYIKNCGTLVLDPSTNLNSVTKNNIYVDGSDNEFVIKLVVNTATEKKLLLEKNLEVDTSSNGEIQSSLDFKKYELNTVPSTEQIIIGVHSKDALSTKYMYVLLKYFLLSRKQSLIKRCFIVSTFQGSDFSRNMVYEGDHVYNRFMTVSGRIDDSWKDGEVDLIDNFDIDVTHGTEEES